MGALKATGAAPRHWAVGVVPPQLDVVDRVVDRVGWDQGAQALGAGTVRSHPPNWTSVTSPVVWTPGWVVVASVGGREIGVGVGVGVGVEEAAKVWRAWGEVDALEGEGRRVEGEGEGEEEEEEVEVEVEADAAVVLVVVVVLAVIVTFKARLQVDPRPFHTANAETLVMPTPLPTSMSMSIWVSRMAWSRVHVCWTMATVLPMMAFPMRPLLVPPRRQRSPTTPMTSVVCRPVVIAPTRLPKAPLLPAFGLALVLVHVLVHVVVCVVVALVVVVVVVGFEPVASSPVGCPWGH